MRPILEIARKHDLYVVEDAAHAIGAEYHGKRIGVLGDATCFSFYATKNITTGEGGAITTDNDQLAEKLRILRLHGISKDAWRRYSSEGSWYYEIQACGWKYNMTDIQASIGLHQLRKLDGFIDIRRRYADIYNKELDEVKAVTTPRERPGIKHAYHLYPILLQRFERGKFIQEMQERGVQCSVHFMPLHLHPFYSMTYGFQRGDFPIAEWIYEREVSLPLYPKMSQKELRHVINSVKEILRF
jgi:dTDP-4-amino-4,6-dideoxygalactose transaminase